MPQESVRKEAVLANMHRPIIKYLASGRNLRSMEHGAVRDACQ